MVSKELYIFALTVSVHLIEMAKALMAGQLIYHMHMHSDTYYTFNCVNVPHILKVPKMHKKDKSVLHSSSSSLLVTVESTRTCCRACAIWIHH